MFGTKDSRPLFARVCLLFCGSVDLLGLTALVVALGLCETSPLPLAALSVWMLRFGYATDETSDCMPLTHSIATRLGKKNLGRRTKADFLGTFQWLGRFVSSFL